MADDSDTNTSDLFGQVQQDYPWTRGIDPGGASNSIDPGSKTSADAMGDVLTNYMPQADPNIQNYRNQILSSTTDDQKADLFDQYQDQKKSGATDSGNFGDWVKNEGGDQFFRGLPTGQISPDQYTDQQKQIYSQMQNYLTARYADMPGSALQTQTEGMPSGALGSGRPALPGVLTPQLGGAAGSLGSGQPAYGGIVPQTAIQPIVPTGGGI